MPCWRSGWTINHQTEYGRLTISRNNDCHRKNLKRIWTASNNCLDNKVSSICRKYKKDRRKLSGVVPIYEKSVNEKRKAMHEDLISRSTCAAAAPLWCS